jgi:opacity protein-like surface antigen
MKLFFAAALVLGSLGVAQAEFTRGAQTVALFGGVGGSSSRYDFEPGKRERVTGGGGAYGAQYLYYLAGSPAIAIGPDFAMSSNGDRDSDELLTGYDTTARLKSTVGLIVARIAFPRGSVRPYLFGGLGAHHSTQRLSARPRGTQTWPGGGTESRMLVDESATSVAVGYGIGLDIFPTESFFIGAELRGTWLAGLDTDDTAASRAAGVTVDEEEGISQGNLFLRVGLKF